MAGVERCFWCQGTENQPCSSLIGKNLISLRDRKPRGGRASLSAVSGVSVMAVGVQVLPISSLRCPWHPLCSDWRPLLLWAISSNFFFKSSKREPVKVPFPQSYRANLGHLAILNQVLSQGNACDISSVWGLKRKTLVREMEYYDGLRPVVARFSP